MFDIDGVLVRGKKLLPNTKKCFKLITDTNGKFKVPTIFVTNAGNELRSSKAAKLSNLLGVNIDPDQVVMSHSPLRMMKQFHNGNKNFAYFRNFGLPFHIYNTVNPIKSKYVTCLPVM